MAAIQAHLKLRGVFHGYFVMKHKDHEEYKSEE